ncbi:hypothetical protein AURDEDRAFT_115817 [Auricularia subglabra TFB-10046 SS5]|nr:hypothetical protein AURDEDRAFT_115817 [Auricularia subglabra TFB-10046 SS5]
MRKLATSRDGGNTEQQDDTRTPPSLSSGACAGDASGHRRVWRTARVSLDASTLAAAL